MTTFKPGDRVRTTAKVGGVPLSECPVGSEGIVESAHIFADDYIDVEFHLPGRTLPITFGVKIEDLELVPSDPGHPYPVGTRVHVASENHGILTGVIMGYPLNPLSVDVLIDEHCLPATLEENPCPWHRFKVRPIPEEDDTVHPGIGCTLTVTLDLTTAEARDLNISDMGQVIDVIAETWPALRVRIESNE